MKSRLNRHDITVSGYKFIIHEKDYGYWAECVDLEGCQTQGYSMTELLENIEEVLDLYLEAKNA